MNRITITTRSDSYRICIIRSIGLDYIIIYSNLDAIYFSFIKLRIIKYKVLTAFSYDQIFFPGGNCRNSNITISTGSNRHSVLLQGDRCSCDSLTGLHQLDGQRAADGLLGRVLLGGHIHLIAAHLHRELLVVGEASIVQSSAFFLVTVTVLASPAAANVSDVGFTVIEGSVEGSPMKAAISLIFRGAI